MRNNIPEELYRQLKQAGFDNRREMLNFLNNNPDSIGRLLCGATAKKGFGFPLGGGPRLEGLLRAGKFSVGFGGELEYEF